VVPGSLPSAGLVSVARAADPGARSTTVSLPGRFLTSQTNQAVARQNTIAEV
jgi:hypothetical protein